MIRFIPERRCRGTITMNEIYIFSDSKNPDIKQKLEKNGFDIKLFYISRDGKKYGDFTIKHHDDMSWRAAARELRKDCSEKDITVCVDYSPGNSYDGLALEYWTLGAYVKRIGKELNKDIEVITYVDPRYRHKVNNYDIGRLSENSTIIGKKYRVPKTNNYKVKKIDLDNRIKTENRTLEEKVVLN